MSVSGEPITKCPVCRYDLTGLPKNHTCPECGFEYDESMRIWIPNWRPRWPWWFVGFYVVLLVLHLSRYAQKGFRLDFDDLFLISGDFLLLAWFVWLIVQWRKPISFVLVGEKGLAYKYLFWPKRFLRWDEIEFPSRASHPRRRLRSCFRKIHLPLTGLNEHDRQVIYQLIRNRQTSTRF